MAALQSNLIHQSPLSERKSLNNADSVERFRVTSIRLEFADEDDCCESKIRGFLDTSMCMHQLPSFFSYVHFSHGRLLFLSILFSLGYSEHFPFALRVASWLDGVGFGTYLAFASASRHLIKLDIRFVREIR